MTGLKLITRKKARSGMCEKITNMQGMCEDIKASARPAKWRLCNYDINDIDQLGLGGPHQAYKNPSLGEKKLGEANKKL